ncbi:MAG: type 1 glutamine amidotransferase domain-containing protein [Acidimicrobiales bacterium]
MSGPLNGLRVAFMTANSGVEQVELTGPWEALGEAGAALDLVAPAGGEVQAMHHDDKGDAFPVDRTTAEARVDDYDLLVLPGGVANPDRLRMDAPAVDLVRAFVAAGKPVGAICHGPWTLVEAGVVGGRTLTSWPSLRTDITNAGGRWVDEQVCADGTLVTSRKPDDVPAFSDKLIEVTVASRAPVR